RLFCSALLVLHATPTTALYTLSLHDALPISLDRCIEMVEGGRLHLRRDLGAEAAVLDRFVRDHEPPRASHRLDDRPEVERDERRSEEHTSELQSPYDLVCRLLLEKKKLNDTI